MDWRGSEDLTIVNMEDFERVFLWNLQKLLCKFVKLDKLINSTRDLKPKDHRAFGALDSLEALLNSYVYAPSETVVISHFIKE